MTASSYLYFATTNNCQCTEFRAMDRQIEYRFRAHFQMRDGISTEIEIEFLNASSDTLYLTSATARVSSRNIPYQFNDKFVPLPPLVIHPHGSNIITLSGNDVSGQDDWHKIAGEQITVTVKGMRLGWNELALQEVKFVPTNPYLGR